MALPSIAEDEESPEEAEPEPSLGSGPTPNVASPKSDLPPPAVPPPLPILKKNPEIDKAKAAKAKGKEPEVKSQKLAELGRAPEPGEPEMKKKNKFGHICKGILYLFLLLFYHFVEFFMTISFGIGVGILASVIHYNFWYKELEAFWQTYVTCITVFLVTELYFRMISRTRFSRWMDRTQKDHWITLYCIPRGLYLTLYVLTVISLFIQYKSVHEELYTTINSTGVVLNYVTPKSPLSLELDDDHYFRTILFVISLAYMMYVLTKESDWMTHRLQVMATGEDDPIAKGSIGSFIVLVGAHGILTCLYALPLVGFVFIFKSFVAGWGETYFIICLMAGCIGVFGSFLERQNLFPTVQMSPPNYAYENHLRIRVSFLHYWLIPLAAGRYFNRSKATKMDATDGDFLVFTMEVAIGVLQASKVVSNDVYLIWFAPKKERLTQEEQQQFPEMLEVNSMDFGDGEEEGEMDDALFFSPVRSTENFGDYSQNSFIHTSSGGSVHSKSDKSIHDLVKRIV